MGIEFGDEYYEVPDEEFNYQEACVKKIIYNGKNILTQSPNPTSTELPKPRSPKNKKNR